MRGKPLYQSDFYKRFGVPSLGEYRNNQRYAAGTWKQKTEIKPKDIFLEKFPSLRGFENLKGYSIPSLETQLDCTMEWRYLKTDKRIYDSQFWLYTPPKCKKPKAIMQIPTDDQIVDCSVWLKTLWIPDEFRGKGYSRDCLEDIFELVLEVNSICKSKQEYKERPISCPGFFAWLCPNPFYVSDWKLDQTKCDIDWSNPNTATKNIIDETKEDLPPEKRAVDWELLRDFYLRLGAEVDDEMHISMRYEWGQFEPVRSCSLTSRSMQKGRYMMRFPALA